jgi:hypothetical protein
MRTMLFTAAAFAVALGAAQAQTPTPSAPAGAGQRCDRDGCWTYNCDSTSNHYHRHWTSSAARGMPMMGAAPPAHRADQLCDADGNNCQDETPPG